MATRHHDKTRRQLTARSVLRNHNKIVGLADSGFPVDTLNARKMVAYLGAAEEANEGTVPMAETVSRNGWHGKHEFVLGHTVLGRHGRSRPVLPNPTAGVDEEWFDCYRAAGSEDVWSDILPIISERPVAFLGLAAALASPLLRPLKAPGFNVEWFGSSSGGKTTSLRCAMSLFGPCQLEDIPNWGATRFAMDTQAAVRGHLPLFLDETGQFEGRRGTLSRIAYMFTEAKGKARGNKDQGVNAIRSWRLVAMWTGEHTVRNMTTDSGIHPRVLSFQGRPFGGPDAASEAAITNVDRIIAEHYGHAGPRFIRQLLDFDKGDWEALRAEYATVIDHLRLIAPIGVPANFLSRWAKAFAAMAVSARMLADMYPARLTRDQAQTCVEKAWKILCENNAESTDYAAKALQDVLDWIASQSSDFTEDPASDGPFKRKNLGRDVLEGLAIIGRELTAFLEEEKYDADVVRAAWAERDWILRDARGKPFFKNVKFGQRQTRCVVLTHAALEVHGGQDTEPEPSAAHPDSMAA